MSERDDYEQREQEEEERVPPPDSEFEPDYSKFNADSVPMPEEEKDIRNYDDVPVGPCPEAEQEREEEGEYHHGRN